jgi:predicted lipoprotein
MPSCAISYGARPVMSRPMIAPAAARLDQAHEALEQRALAHAVAPHQADRLAARDLEIDAAQDVAGAVVAVAGPWRR